MRASRHKADRAAFLLRLPIRLQLLLMVAIVAIPAAGLIIYGGTQDKARARSHARTDTQSLAETVAAEQRVLVASARQLLVTLAQLPEINDQDAAATGQFLARILKLNPNLINIFVADRSGTIWASALPARGKVTVADRPYFRQAMATGRLTFGEYQVGRISGTPSLNLAYPYWNGRGGLAGVICLSISLKYYRIFMELAQMPRDSSMLLLDRNGIILLSTSRIDKPGSPLSPAMFRRMERGGAVETFVHAGGLGSAPEGEMYVSYRKLSLDEDRAPYLYVMVGVPVASALSEANRQILFSMLLLGCVLVGALSLASFIGDRSIADRIRHLEGAARALAAGDLQVRASELVRGGELGRLAQSFDAMVEELAARERMLAEHRRRLEELNRHLESRVDSAVADSRHKDQILIHQSRQAAMGEMIGNIAHQWRQPLNILGLIVQELLMTYGREEFTRETLQANVGKAMELISHMSRTIDDLSSYFKPSREKRPFRVAEAVAHTLSLVDWSLKDQGIRVELSAHDDAVVNGYEKEYSQVLVNILLNARDAYAGRNDRGEKVIAIAVSEEDGASVVTVADNAGGIDPDIIEKIFDPYFTTKGPDKGTGIGLYMAKVIVEQHMQGRLTVRNLADGAEFRIELAAGGRSPSEA